MSTTSTNTTTTNNTNLLSQKNESTTAMQDPMSQFSSLLTSPGAVSFWPMQSPLDGISFPFNHFPTTPTFNAKQFLTSPLFQHNNHNSSSMNNIQFQGMNHTNTNNSLLEPLTPSNGNLLLPSSMSFKDNMNANLSNFEQQLQNMINMESINRMDQFPNIQNLPQISDFIVSDPNANASQITVKQDDTTQNMLSNDNQTAETLVRPSKRGRKRKIKQEHDSLKMEEPPTKKKRGRKRKLSENGTEVPKDALQVLSEKMKQRNEQLYAKGNDDSDDESNAGFIGIRTADGEVKISIPAKIEVAYEMYGDACTDKIEDILQAKCRTRYVRGLTEQEKKSRRREQNRNAAARSRARKNAMISKVIQLHQENLGLRAHTAKMISTMKKLKAEIQALGAEPVTSSPLKK